MGGALFIPFAFSVVLQQRLLLSECSVQTSPDTTFFPSNYLPYLFCMVPCRYGALSCIADFSSYKTLYAISVRQTRVLPAVSLFPHPATFRFAIACNTLAFGYLLPATGRIRDFHPLKMGTERTIPGSTDHVFYPVLPVHYTLFKFLKYFNFYT